MRITKRSKIDLTHWISPISMYLDSHVETISDCAPSFIKKVDSCDGKFRFTIQRIENPELIIDNITFYKGYFLRNNEDFLYKKSRGSPEFIEIDFCSSFIARFDASENQQNWSKHPISDQLENRKIILLKRAGISLEMEFADGSSFSMKKIEKGVVKFQGVEGVPDEVHMNNFEKWASNYQRISHDRFFVHDTEKFEKETQENPHTYWNGWYLESHPPQVDVYYGCIMKNSFLSTPPGLQLLRKLSNIGSKLKVF